MLLLPGAPPLAEEHADVDRAVAYWGGSPAVRHRLDALARASASIVLFLEHIPQNLQDWLATRPVGVEGTDAYSMVERGLRAGAAFMHGNGLLHFDAHLRNILTDGRPNATSTSGGAPRAARRLTCRPRRRRSSPGTPRSPRS
ncbi:hypothetical protein [Micromonospora sp. NPDC006431]|uniref:hypothetical protein n=1 Tax=Micromonospora sp. NPDC006431 TaxID=3364235 RepID=UPI0036C3416B